MIANGREIIRAGYAAGRSCADIAKECDSTPGSVKVTAHAMGLKHPSKAAQPPEPGKRRVPPFAGHDRYELPWGGPTVTEALRS